MDNPIWKSRRLWVGVLDIVISLILYFIAKYVPNAIEDVKFVVLLIQPLALTFIIAYTFEDIALIKAATEKHNALVALEETKVYNQVAEAKQATAAISLEETKVMLDTAKIDAGMVKSTCTCASEPE